VTDRPILFSAPMVKALLASRKTQTRRMLKPQPDDLIEGQLPTSLRISVGDRLWVREAFSYDALDVDHDASMPAWYWADGNPEDGDWTRPKPSIHMPRAYSRMTLTVTDVRVMRLMSITEADAMAEGAEPILVPPDGGSAPHVEGFRQLWNSIHGPDADFANPWVGAYTFTVEQKNIDA